MLIPLTHSLFLGSVATPSLPLSIALFQVRPSSQQTPNRSNSIWTGLRFVRPFDREDGGDLPGLIPDNERASGRHDRFLLHAS